MNIKAKLQGARKSLTIWFNGTAAAVVAGLPIAQDSLPQLHSYLPANFYQYAMGGVIFANILLRFKTNNGLEHK